jgi:serine/threonine protein kinase
MPDCDWVRYKQIRGNALPERIAFRGVDYTQDCLFKRDFYAATGRYVRQSGKNADDLPERLVVKVYHLDALWKVIPLRWMGRWLFRRERYFGELLRDAPGIAHIIGRLGKSGLVREYVPGQDLRQFKKTARPDTHFFPALARTLAELHRRGVSHNDLSKPENVLVDSGGAPVLIDFQIAIHWRGAPARWLARYFQKTDRYHLRKQHRRCRPEDFSWDQIADARKKGLVLTLHDWLLRRPYRAVRHFFLRRLLTQS